MKDKLQGWLADRFERVQYPHVRRIQKAKVIKESPASFGHFLILCVLGGAAVIAGCVAAIFGITALVTLI